MKTLQIENTREIFFNDSKEQYLHFKDVWSQAVNSEKAKKTVTEHTYPSHYWQGGQSIDDSKKWTTRENGWLTRTHHLVYALMCGKVATKGFTPITNKNKLEHGAYINHGLYFAYQDLRGLAKLAQSHLRHVEKGSNTWFLKRKSGDEFEMPSNLKNFLEPFQGTINLEMLIKLFEHCPKVDVIESNFGKGKKLAQKIISGEIKPITYADMQEMYA